MAAPDFLSQLPSIEELLAHPRVTAAVERLNQSSAATRVRTAFAELAGEVTRRADELSGLTPAELVERFVGRIERAADSRESTGGAVNATGAINAAGFVGTRLPAAAVSAAAAVAGGGRRVSDATERAAAEVIGCDAACVLASHAAALRATLEAVAASGVVIVARADMHSLANGGRLDRLVASIGAELVEVGAADTVGVDDYRGALSDRGDRPAAVLLRRGAQPLPVRVGVREVAAVARAAGAVTVCDVEAGPPRRDTPAGDAAAWSAQACLAEMADAAIIDARGAIGGPVAGIVAAKRSWIAKIDATQSASELRIDPMVGAALEATLRLFLAPQRLRFVHPRYALLDTPGENLRVRAERLAQLLAASQRYDAVEAVELGSAEPAADGPTWGVRLRTADKTLAKNLLRGEPAIAVRCDGDSVVLDLRTVSPGEDATLCRVLGGESDDHATGRSAS